MPIQILKYQFSGPYFSTSSLEDRSGVYIILKPESNSYSVIDVGESAALRSRIENHDRRPCWNLRAGYNNWQIAVYYTPQLQAPGRQQIEQELRQAYKPPCGSQ